MYETSFERQYRLGEILNKRLAAKRHTEAYKAAEKDPTIENMILLISAAKKHGAAWGVGSE